MSALLYTPRVPAWTFLRAYNLGRLGEHTFVQHPNVVSIVTFAACRNVLPLVVRFILWALNVPWITNDRLRGLQLRKSTFAKMAVFAEDEKAANVEYQAEVFNKPSQINILGKPQPEAVAKAS